MSQISESVRVDPQHFIQSLQEEIVQHPAVQHPFLLRFAEGKLTLKQIQTFGLQHYQLVKVFLNYMTNLLPRIPDPDAADLFRKVFEDELGQYTLFRSHPALYRNFLKAVGVKEEEWGKTTLLPETEGFIQGHLQFSRDSDFLSSLGAVGPGHELSIPTMFTFILSGLTKSIHLAEEQVEYFALHIEQDVEHARLFNILITRHTGTHEGQTRVRDGALYSLSLRKRFWDGLSRLVFSTTPFVPG